MIFGEYPQSFYLQLFIACVVVPGLELGDTGTYGERFIDNKRVEGTIEEMLDGTLKFLIRNMKTSIIIDSNGKRTNKTEYPLEALREIITNALIHRDYSTLTENAYISVYMYNDRVEIISPGSLYGTNKLEELGTPVAMETRNPTIVRLLEEKSDLIENRHSGIPTAIREMKEYGLPEPEFYSDHGCFRVVLRNGSEQVNEQVSEQVIDIQSGQQESLEKYKKMVLDYCKEPRTAKEIREHLQLKSRNYVNDKIIKPLIKLNLLDYINKRSVSASNQKYITVKK